MTYDREDNRIVTQDSRVWIAGLGDEGGSSWLAGDHEAARPARPRRRSPSTRQFVDSVVWGGLQYADGPRQYAVRKSLFYYAARPAARRLLSAATSTGRPGRAGRRTRPRPSIVATTTRTSPRCTGSMYRLARNHVGPRDQPSVGLVSRRRAVPDRHRHGRARAALRAVRADGRHGLPRDPARPAARGLDGRGGRRSRRG